jgi:hypothetical protein
MFRKVAVVALVLTSICSCAQMNPRLASSQYCLVQSGSPCSPMSGDGFCQPCP